ncbi:MAG: type II secretion system F family protein [Planctomycetota bacterium]|nr:type II secretion system F family protein [Planctomycetota bacterium]
MSLRNYDYTATDGAGVSRRGCLLATDEPDAYRRIVGGGLTPLEIRERRERAPLFSAPRVKLTDVVGLTRELAVLTEARIPLDRGLASIAEDAGRGPLTDIVRAMAAAIESGQPLTDALEKHRAIFGDVYVETIRAGEKSGNLAAVMTHLADLLERQLEVRQQVRRALAYPLIVIGVVAIAVGVIVVLVVPKFAETFAAQQAQLPLATRVLQAVGQGAQASWAELVAAAAFAVVGVTVAWMRPWGRAAFERVFLRVPYLRDVIIAITAGRFARVLAISLTSGLDLVESVRIGGRATGRPLFAQECQAIAERLRTGEPFVEAIRGSAYLPSFAVRMLGAGKDSRELARSCEVVARYYDRDASHLTKNVSTIIEPLITVALAAIVLLVALAVFLPMWKVASISQ